MRKTIPAAKMQRQCLSLYKRISYTSCCQEFFLLTVEAIMHYPFKSFFAKKVGFLTSGSIIIHISLQKDTVEGNGQLNGLT